MWSHGWVIITTAVKDQNTAHISPTMHLTSEDSQKSKNEPSDVNWPEDWRLKQPRGVSMAGRHWWWMNGWTNQFNVSLMLQQWSSALSVLLFLITSPGCDTSESFSADAAQLTDQPVEWMLLTLGTYHRPGLHHPVWSLRNKWGL